MKARRLQNAEIIWEDESLPRAARFDEAYFSRADGLAETRHVFLGGNNLPARFAPGFHIAELGFGTGLNALVAAAAWTGPGRLRYTAFEAYPMQPDDAARALARWDLPEKGAILAGLAANLRYIVTERLELTLIIGDARETLPRADFRADAWFLDGFSPAKNPELWEAPLLDAVAAHTAPGGTFATYTAAGHVRRALAEAGFAVERCKGFGNKKHMTRGILGAGDAG